MAHPQRPSFLKWLFHITIMLVGAVFLGLFLFHHFFGTTPEDELTLAEGVPSDVERSQSTGRGGHTTYFVYFTVGEYRTEYGSNDPKYHDVSAAVASGYPIQIWVSTRQETLFRLTNLVPLYKVQYGNRPILTYSEVVANRSDKSWPVLIVGAALFIIGSWEVYLCFRSRRRNEYIDGTQVVRNLRGKILSKVWPALEISYRLGNNHKRNAIKRLATFFPLGFVLMGVGIYFHEPYSIVIGGAVGFLILFLLWLMSRNPGKSIEASSSGDAHE
jgi:hypothetical protein